MLPYLVQTLDHLLYLDGVKVPQRRLLEAEPSSIVWGETIVERRQACASFCGKLAGYRARIRCL